MKLVDALENHGKARRVFWARSTYVTCAPIGLLAIRRHGNDKEEPWVPTIGELEATDYGPYAESLEDKLARYYAALVSIAAGDNGCGSCGPADSLRQIARDALAGGGK